MVPALEQEGVGVEWGSGPPQQIAPEGQEPEAVSQPPLLQLKYPQRHVPEQLEEARLRMSKFFPDLFTVITPTVRDVTKNPIISKLNGSTKPFLFPLFI